MNNSRSAKPNVNSVLSYGPLRIESTYSSLVTTKRGYIGRWEIARSTTFQTRLKSRMHGQQHLWSTQLAILSTTFTFGTERGAVPWEREPGDSKSKRKPSLRTFTFRVIRTPSLPFRKRFSYMI